MPTDLKVNNQNLTSLQDKLWFVLKAPCELNTKINYRSNYDYSLKLNDILKLGRIKFQVKHINILGKTVEKSEMVFKPYEDAEIIQKTEDEQSCRICLYDTMTEDNPMIALCKCKGTNILHFKCLQAWLQHKVSIREIPNKFGVSYTLKSFNCEICKELYPCLLLTKQQ